MKAELLIPHYLITHGKLSLQGIGTFTYSGATSTSEDVHRNVSFEEDSISFLYDSKAVTDDSFIQFLVTHTGKIRSLTASDLESYLITGKQFLNIGKPLLMKDMGYLVKIQSGSFEFKQGLHQPEIIDTHSQGSKNRLAGIVGDGSRPKDEIDFSSPAPPNNLSQRKWIAGTVVLVLVMAGVITGLYNFNDNKEKNKVSNEMNQPVLDSSKIKDTINKASTPLSIDNIGFDLILKHADTNQNVSDFLEKMSKKRLPVLTDSSDTNRVVYYLHYELPYRDTTVMRDSLKLMKVPILNIRLN